MKVELNEKEVIFTEEVTEKLTSDTSLKDKVVKILLQNTDKMEEVESDEFMLVSNPMGYTVVCKTENYGKNITVTHIIKNDCVVL